METQEHCAMAMKSE